MMPAITTRARTEEAGFDRGPINPDWPPSISSGTVGPVETSFVFFFRGAVWGRGGGAGRSAGAPAARRVGPGRTTDEGHTIATGLNGRLFAVGQPGRDCGRVPRPSVGDLAMSATMRSSSFLGISDLIYVCKERNNMWIFNRSQARMGTMISVLEVNSF